MSRPSQTAHTLPPTRVIDGHPQLLSETEAWACIRKYAACRSSDGSEEVVRILDWQSGYSPERVFLVENSGGFRWHAREANLTLLVDIDPRVTALRQGLARTYAEAAMVAAAEAQLLSTTKDDP